MDPMAALADFERRYLELRRQIFSARWDLYARGRTPELDELSASMFALARSATERSLPDGRRSDVLGRSLERELVDSHPDVSGLANRLTTGRGYPDPGRRGISAKALAVEPDVIELVHRRNAIARRRGWDDYARFVISLVGLDPTALRELVWQIREGALAEADAQPAAADDAGGDHAVHRAFGPRDGAIEATALLDQLGLAHLAPMIRWHVEPDGFPYDGPVSVPDDIRVLLPETRSFADVAAAFHELGHATMHVANRRSGVLTTWNELWDESMAVTMERIGVALRFDREAQRAQRRLDHRERRRLSTSFLFELDLIAHPDRARSSYEHWYGAIGDVDAPELWAIDTFRVEDPVHVYTYVVGEIVANAVVDHLLDRFEDEHRRWGRWLEANAYADGRSTGLFEKLDRLGEHRPIEVSGLASR